MNKIRTALEILRDRDLLTRAKVAVNTAKAEDMVTYDEAALAELRRTPTQGGTDV